MNKQYILDKERIAHKLQRMAYEVWEHNSEERSLLLIGIAGGGVVVAENLAERLRQISNLEVRVATMEINKKKPLDTKATWKEDISAQAVVIVDDVANSGKTLLYALKPLLEYEPKRIRIAVLVDRKHKSFPVAPDIVGHTIATTLKEHIIVENKGNEIISAYLQ